MSAEIQDEQGTLKVTFKCSNHEINSGNSDAECFDEVPFISACYVVENPNICNLCTYNNKYKDMNYKEWKKFKEENKL